MLGTFLNALYRGWKILWKFVKIHKLSADGKNLMEFISGNMIWECLTHFSKLLSLGAVL